MNVELKKIQNQIDEFKSKHPDESVGELGDTYHSFNDLYKHRTVLLALALINLPYAWKSRKHEDGSMFDDMFIVGAPTPDGMITYHCDNEYWGLFKIPEIPHAPHFDGHTPEDVIDRLTNYIGSTTSRLVNEKNIYDIEDIIKRDILPVFGDDIVAEASFIGFYSK